MCTCSFPFVLCATSWFPLLLNYPCCLRRYRKYAASSANPCRDVQVAWFTMTVNTQEEDSTHSAAPEYINIVAYARFARLLRPLAYSNELGEVVRNSFPKLVLPLYVVSFGYVGLDVAAKSFFERERGAHAVVLKGADTLAWHSVASIFVPSFIVHQAVKQTNSFCSTFLTSKRFAKVGRFGPPLVGLALIPFIVGPIDHGTDWLFNNFIRKTYTTP